MLMGANDFAARGIPPGENARVRFQKLIERPRVPLQAVEQAAAEVDGFTETPFSFQAEAGERVPGLLVAATRATGPRPVVIVLHGTGGSKQSMRPMLRKLAAKGFLGVAIDGRFAGERAGGAKGSEAYRAAILETWRTGRGFPLFYDTVWDVARLVDYLETRPDVDTQRIGAIGFSKG
ncbi:MAG TPA: dienelactone hydrolase family protein, partial [Planctomycetaceae bacterium]|nr:dienelactone hydrolase family protein [Planctomycetaceae bacterium]